MKKIEEHIIEMLLENTGTHLLDSGGKEGRLWQRNQGKIFDDEKRVELEFYDGIFEYEIVSTYHYLSEVLDNTEISEQFTDLLRDKDSHWVQEGIEFIKDEGYDIDNVREVVNTYNGENNLSQILLFSTFTYNEEAYVLLQIHGGADVRGGYTNARCFKLEGYLTGQVDVYGSVNGENVENTYNGHSITKESGEEIEIKEADEFYLDFHVMNETYMYDE